MGEDITIATAFEGTVSLAGLAVSDPGDLDEPLGLHAHSTSPHLALNRMPVITATTAVSMRSTTMRIVFTWSCEKPFWSDI